MQEILDTISVSLVVFLVVVAPLWLILHYRAQRDINKGLSESEFNQLRELAVKAEKMSERITMLESILDSESPQWRERV